MVVSYGASNEGDLCVSLYGRDWFPISYIGHEKKSEVQNGG